jgi:diguanylate cyclase (GGDEF)-like protein
VPQVIPFGAARAALLLPLISHDEVIGIVALLCDRSDHPFDAPLVDFLQDIAQQIAFGVENARLFSELTRMARTDELTGIANRRRFMEVAEANLHHAHQSGMPFALILADLDHLKRVNDGYGHAAGDLAIEHTARTMERHLTGEQLAARIGGEEFAIALPDTQLPAAVDIAEQIRSDLSNAFVTGVGRVTASFGVASCPADGQSMTTLLKAADERLYQAKAAGRNRVGWKGVSPHQAEIPYDPDS